MNVNLQADRGVQSKSKTKKVLSILFKVLCAIIIAILLFVAIVYTVNKISSYSEQKRMEPYGQHVSVDGKNMNVFIQGEGEETIVLLPGFGTAAPALDFKPLISELSPYYKVVVVEPFGYGLSDQTKRNVAQQISSVKFMKRYSVYILIVISSWVIPFRGSIAWIT